MIKMIRSLYRSIKKKFFGPLPFTVPYPGIDIDATSVIQDAINNNREVIIPLAAGDWTVSTQGIGSLLDTEGKEWVSRSSFYLKSNFTLTINGTISAKKGSFLGKYDSVLGGNKVNNVILNGTGTIKMQRSEYDGEHRHCCILRGCTNVKVSGLTFRDSGGDGLYIGPTEIDLDRDRIPCQSIAVSDCIMDNNRRQGISVLSAKDLTIKNCLFTLTKGTAPQAAIDLEPNHPKDQLTNIVVRDCRSISNDGSGLLIILDYMTEASSPISILIDDCYVYGSKQPGIRVKMNKGKGPPRGTIEFRSCKVETIRYAGMHCTWDTSKNIFLKFQYCNFMDCAKLLILDGQKPFEFVLTGDGSGPGIFFDECQVFETLDRKVINVTIENSPVSSSSSSGSGFSASTIFSTIRGVIWIMAKGFKPSIKQSQPSLPNLRLPHSVQ